MNKYQNNNSDFNKIFFIKRGNNKKIVETRAALHEILSVDVFCLPPTLCFQPLLHMFPSMPVSTLDLFISDYLYILFWFIFLNHVILFMEIFCSQSSPSAITYCPIQLLCYGSLLHVCCHGFCNVTDARHKFLMYYRICWTRKHINWKKSKPTWIWLISQR